MDYQLVVVGGGAGGMAAARAGARRGLRTLLVQDGRVGGDCTFTGCVPSKALIAAAARGASFDDAMAQVRRAVDAVAASEDADVFRKEGVEVIEGRASFRSPNEIEVDGRRVGADRFVVATGAVPAVPDVDGLPDVAYVTSETVWDLPALPASLAVVGGGPLGCELGQVFARLGARVTVVGKHDRLLTKEEPEASRLIEDRFRADGIDLRLGETITRVEALDGEGRARLHLRRGPPVEADRLLVAVGRRPCTTGLNVEAAGAEVDESGFVKTDDYLATTSPTVWAVGDVAGKLQFTHAADEMGRIAVGNAFGRLRVRRFRAEWTPWVTFTSPEVARVGMAEAEAAEHGGRVAFLPMGEVDRALAEDDTAGFVKLVAGRRPLLGDLAGGRIVGATVVAPRAGEMIHEAVLAMRTAMFTARFALAVRAYPTWSMAMQKAASQFFIDVEGRSATPARRGGPLRT